MNPTLDEKLEAADKRLSRKIRKNVEAEAAAADREARRDKRVVPGFDTLPRDLRPLSVNLAALRKTRIGPLFPRDPDAKIGMRGVPVGQRATRPGAAVTRIKGGARHWMEHRVRRRARRLVASASRAANR